MNNECKIFPGYSIVSVYIYIILNLFLISGANFVYASDITPAEFEGLMRTSTANTLVFDPRRHTYEAINNQGKVVRTGRASGGANYCRDIKRGCRTPVGSFSIIGKRGASCRSSRYPVGKGGAPMPYCMFFSKYYAIHGSYDVPNHNASHGCIRVKPNDARWLYSNFIHIGTKVKVKPY